MANWDVFCSVVDNYGDIGVTWRLARQLAGEHGQRVRLWVDDLAAFVRICPAADGAAESQHQSGVEVRLWPKPWQDTQAADVVIEAFACEMPPAYIEAMKQRRQPPLWLNLEYLSAEPWVESCHGLPSMQANGLQKYFYFPGFTPATGGLLRESDLIARRDAFQADPAASLRFLESLGVHPRAHERRISLFAYENAALGSWLDALAASSDSILLLVPEGRVLADVERWAQRTLKAGGSSSAVRCACKYCPSCARRTTTRSCGVAMSTRCVVRIPSCGRSGRGGHSSGTSTSRMTMFTWRSCRPSWPCSVTEWTSRCGPS